MSGQGEDTPQRRLRLGTWALTAYLVLAAPFAVAGGLALAPAQTLAGALGAPWARIWRQPAEIWAFVAALLAFTGWVAASVMWAPDPETLQHVKLSGAVIVGLLFAAGCGVDAESRRRVRAAGVGFAAVLVVLLIIEAAMGMPLNRLDQPDAAPVTLMRNPSRGATVLVVAIWGVAAALGGGKAHERWIWRALVLGTAAISLQFDMNANALAMGAGAVAFAVALTWPRFAALSLTGGLAAWLLAAPFLTPIILGLPQLQGRLPDSWIVRGEIWKFICTRIAENPLWGAGIDASRQFPAEVTYGHLTFRQVPLHPHSASLQIWYETGAIGAALGAVALLAGGIALARKLGDDTQAMAGACATIAAAGLIANVSYGAWQEWWVASVFLAAGLAAAARR